MRPGPAPGVVRLLAPLDPLVWDRRRFEHFWGWPCRFETCTQRRIAFRRALDAELTRLGRFLTPWTPARAATAAGGTP